MYTTLTESQLEQAIDKLVKQSEQIAAKIERLRWEQFQRQNKGVKR